MYSHLLPQIMMILLSFGSTTLMNYEGIKHLHKGILPLLSYATYTLLQHTNV